MNENQFEGFRRGRGRQGEARREGREVKQGRDGRDAEGKEERQEGNEKALSSPHPPPLSARADANTKPVTVMSKGCVGCLDNVQWHAIKIDRRFQSIFRISPHAIRNCDVPVSSVVALRRRALQLLALCCSR